MSVKFQIAGVPEAVAKAREIAAQAAARWVSGETLETTRLLVSELVTNSIVHGGCERPLQISIESEGNRLHVEVKDCGRGFAPRPRAMASDGAGGFGLFLVEQLADRWGVARDGATCVWFELVQSGDR